MNDAPCRVVLGTDTTGGWDWIASLYQGPPSVRWLVAGNDVPGWLARLPGPHWGRIAAGLRTRRLVRAGAADLLVSLGPRQSFHQEAIGLGRRHGVPHLAWAFNFTDLPTGARHAAMARVFRRIDRFIVSSRMERGLYARIFDIPESRFLFAHWGVRPPIEAPGPRVIPAPYLAAIGGEGRDYRTLCAAARRLPGRRFVVVARPHNLAGVDVPANVEVRTNIAWAEAWSLAAHADALLLPLRSADTPNGHVTLVGGMHLGKAQVVTDSRGIHDYVADGISALLASTGDDRAFAHAIERLLDEPALAARLGAAAQGFARQHCTEAATLACFHRQLIELTASR